ncbi:MAG TPA: hypothetical protein VEL11_15480 [Candidatus Bathyarchaeia archaeon]|nr:hypothetical protein [Candidatus Bathyarchaeia archaeon]
MFSPNVSVPQAIKEILSSNNLYLQALLSGIANYTALAEKIKPDVEKLTGSEVNMGTIVVAIKRLADRLQEEEKIQNESDLKHILPIIEGARMSLTGSVIDIDFNESRFDQLSDIFDEIFEKETNHKYSLFQTDKQIRLLLDDVEEIRSTAVKASKKFDGKIRGGLSKITITIPSLLNNNNDRRKYHRFISSVSDIIYNSRIELQDAFYTPNEIVLVLNDTDAAKAYELLRAKLK